MAKEIVTEDVGNDAPTVAVSASISRFTSVDNLPQFLTVEELQAYLLIGRTSAYEFARQHGRRFGRLLRVPREAIGRDSALIGERS